MALSKIDVANMLTGVTPVANGGTALTSLAGFVKQVVQASINSEVSTTSGIFVTSGISVNITPSSSSNKVLLFFNGVGGTNDTDGNYFTFYRDSTNLGGGNGHVRMRGVSGGFESGISMCELDSPSTSSQISYAVYFAKSGGTTTISTTNTISTITAIEISA